MFFFSVGRKPENPETLVGAECSVPSPAPHYLLNNILDYHLTYLFTFFFFEQVLSSAVQCSLTEDSLLKIPQQKPVVSVKPEAQCDEECDDNGSDTDSVCSDCSGNEW